MDTVKDVFKRELRKKFVAKTFAIALFGRDSEPAKGISAEFDAIYTLSSALYPEEKFLEEIYNE